MVKRGLIMSTSIAEDHCLTGLLPETGGVVSPDSEFCDTMMAQCLDALPVMIWVTNARGGITFYNRAAYQYHGPRIALAREAHERADLFSPEDFVTKSAARARALRTGLEVRVCLRTIRYDYTSRWHAFHLTPLFGKPCMVTGLLITMTDIHDQHDVLQSYRRMTADV